MRLISIFFISLLCLGSVFAFTSNSILNPDGNELQAHKDGDGSGSVSGISSFLRDSTKIQQLLVQEAESLGSGEIPVIAQFNNKLSQEQRSELLQFTEAIHYEYSIINAAAFSVDVSQLDELSALSFVSYVEYDADTRIVLAQSTTQIGASRVWLGHNVFGEGVKIAVLDTGIDNEHPDVKNVIAEQDFTGEGTDDLHGHGTHVASTAAGTGESSGGLNKGVAPKASLMDVKVLDKSGSGKLSDTIAGIEWAVINNADIISMSLGSDIPCNGLDATSLAADVAVQRGKHVVVAAGNLGPLPGSIGSPGCARDVITVGAVDRLDGVALFSSRGPTLDGRVKPDIMAPGVLIIAAKAGGGYAAMSGTSMATPHVSGVIALILSQTKGLSPEQVKKVLMETAVDLGEDANTQGAGRVDAYEAFIKSSGLTPVEPPKEESPENETEKEKEKKEVEKKCKDEGYVDDVRRVDEKKSGEKQYWVVVGSKEGSDEFIVVWVDEDTLQIEKVEIMSFLGKMKMYMVEFFEYLGSFFMSKAQY